MALSKRSSCGILTGKHTGIQRVAAFGPDVICALLSQVRRDLLEAFVRCSQTGVAACFISVVALRMRGREGCHNRQYAGELPQVHFSPQDTAHSLGYTLFQRGRQRAPAMIIWMLAVSLRQVDAGEEQAELDEQSVPAMLS